MIDKNTNLIIGKMDTGKTKGKMFNVLEKAISKKENLLILDNKKEYYSTYKEELDKIGYKTLVLNLDEADCSNGWNPLYLPYKFYKEGNKDFAISLLKKLALELFKSDNPNSDPFWDNSAAEYFIFLSLILFEEGKEEQINIGSLGMMVNQSEQTINDIIVCKKYIDDLDIMDVKYIIGSPVVNAPSETRGSILSVMKQQVNMILTSEKLLNLLSTNQIQIDKLNEKTAIFIIGNKEYNSITNIFIDQLVIYNNLNKNSYTYILDNFDTLPVLLTLEELNLKASLNNNKVYVAIKSLEEVSYRYGKFFETKFSNIEEIKKPIKTSKLGVYNKYPSLETTNKKYFNFKEFVINNTK